MIKPPGRLESLSTSRISVSHISLNKHDEAPREPPHPLLSRPTDLRIRPEYHLLHGRSTAQNDGRQGSKVAVRHESQSGVAEEASRPLSLRLWSSKRQLTRSSRVEGSPPPCVAAVALRSRG